MTIATVLPIQPENCLLFKGLTCREFKVVEQLLEQPGHRISFLNGTLESRQMPGEPHAKVKKRIAALLELYLLMAGFDFQPTGSMTLADEAASVKPTYDCWANTACTTIAPAAVAINPNAKFTTCWDAF